MAMYPGGCAILLKIPEDERLHHTALGWALNDPRWVTDPKDYHLTLQFVGRGLPWRSVVSMIVTAFEFASDRPAPSLKFTGELDVFRTSKGDHLVAHIHQEDFLLTARKEIQGNLALMDVAPKDSFDFRPHVTIGEMAPMSRPPVPPPIEAFSVQCSRLIVKYGPHRMPIEFKH